MKPNLKRKSSTDTESSADTKSFIRWINCLNGMQGDFFEFPTQILANPNQVGVYFLKGDSGEIFLSPGDPIVTVLMNGAPLVDKIELQSGFSFSLQINQMLFVFCRDPKDEWNRDYVFPMWTLYDAETMDVISIAQKPEDIPILIQRYAINVDKCIVSPYGVPAGFYLSLIASILMPTPQVDTNPISMSEVKGDFFCPSCWMPFNSGDALSISAHDSLRGDPILGEDARLRFYPVAFNDNGMALDPMGLPCTDIACPYCRKKMPPGFLEHKHEIISLIGAPSAGKSYYLAVLMKMLQEHLGRDFGMVFKDEDPSGNVLLNQMRNKLFSAKIPEDAILQKTTLEGSTYETLYRHGKMVALPKPFIYGIVKDDEFGHNESSVIFYDNAGEHFEPGFDMEDSPGALHIVYSSGLIFLFDPIVNKAFQKKIEKDCLDPQLLIEGRFDQQDVILAEMEVRIKQMLSMPFKEKIKTPFAFVIGKSDVLTNVFDDLNLEEVKIVDKKMDFEAINRNSEKIRNRLLELSPGIVSCVESFAENICYFTVSALGHSPVKLTEGPYTGMIAPIPKLLNPKNVEIPFYWLWSQICPKMF